MLKRKENPTIFYRFEIENVENLEILEFPQTKRPLL